MERAGIRGFDDSLRRALPELHVLPAARTLLWLLQAGFWSVGRAIREGCISGPAEALIVYEWLSGAAALPAGGSLLRIGAAAGCLAASVLLARTPSVRSSLGRLRDALSARPALEPWYLRGLALWNASLLADAFTGWLWLPIGAAIAALGLGRAGAALDRRLASLGRPEPAPRPLDNLLERWAGQFHILLAVQALSRLCSSLSETLILAFPSPPFVAYDWVKPHYSPHKRVVIIAYLLTAAGLGAGFVFLRTALGRSLLHRVRAVLRDHPAPARPYLRVLALWNVSLMADSFSSWLWIPFAAVFAALWPRSGLRERAGPFLERADRLCAGALGPRSPAWIAGGALAFAGLAWAMTPILKGPILVNEFFDLSEQTWMRSLGAWVDNTSYINRHRLLGLSKAESGSSQSAEESLDERELKGLAARHGPEQLEFLEKNHFELGKQILARWTLHHHNYVLAPLMHLELGLGLEGVPVQYGYLNLAILRGLIRLAGGVDLKNYFRVWYSFWPLYALALAAAAYWLTRDPRHACLAAVLTCACALRYGYDGLLLGPGFNPIRHFLDLPVALCLSMAALGRPGWLIAAHAAALLAVLNNRHFGLFALAALAAAVPAWVWLARDRAPLKEILGGLLSLAAGLAVARLDLMGGDRTASHLLGGLDGAHWRQPCVVAALALTLLAGYLPFSRARTSRLLLPSAFLFLYAQAALVYYVWGGSMYNFLAVAPILVLAGLCLLKLSAETGGLRREGLVLAAAAAAAACVALPAFAFYARTRAIHEWVFKTHRVYPWDFPGAGIASTMDPEPFARASELIARREEGKRVYMISQYDTILPFLARKVHGMPGLELSKVLHSPRELALSVERIERDRPRLLFVDTQIDRDRSGERVLLHYSPPRPVRRGWLGRAEDLLCRLAGSQDRDYFEFAQPRLAQSESKLRLNRLNVLREVFARVRADYEPVERTPLITAYRRRG